MSLSSSILEAISVHCDVDMPAKESEIAPMLYAAAKSKLATTKAFDQLLDKKTREYFEATLELVKKKRKIVMPTDLIITDETAANAVIEEEESEQYKPISSPAKTIGRAKKAVKTLDPTLLEDDIDHHPEYDTQTLASLFSLWDGEIIVIPYFQREFCWNNTAQEAFLVSWMKGTPIPHLLLAQDPADKVAGNPETLDVIDGLQRLSTFRAFRDGQIKYKGYSFDELPDNIRNRFLLKKIAIATAHTPREYWGDIFRDVNTNGAPLNTMEMRRQFFIKSEFLNMLYKLARKHKVWLELYGSSKRARGLEQLVRSCAMHLMYKQYDKGMEKFLDNFCAKSLTEDFDLVAMQKHLNNVLNAMVQLGTQKAFKVGERKNINKGLVDCLLHAGIQIDKLNRKEITTDKLGLLLQNVRDELLKDPRMILSMTLHSNTIDSVRYRMEQTECLVEEALLGERTK